MRFLEKFAAKARALPAGDPRNGDVVLGSLVNQDAVDAGARARSTTRWRKARGWSPAARSTAPSWPRPCSIGVTPAMRIYARGSLRPGGRSCCARTDVEDAVRIANDTEYGLAAAVFGRDVARALEVAKRIESGICHINAATVDDEPQMPFGGTKASGYGRFGGKAAIDAIHRAALDHDRDRTAELSVLKRSFHSQ